jgi:hypothetical protein
VSLRQLSFVAAAVTAGMLLTVPMRASAAPAPGPFYVSVKRTELANDWGRLWEMLDPRQRAFISRKLFVGCLGKQPLRHPPVRSIRVLRVESRRLSIPGVGGAKVPTKVITIRIVYREGAPSQMTVGKVTRFRGRWYWITSARSASEFARANFCS